MSFQINTNLNSINDFNKILNSQFQNVNNNMEQANEFSSIFNATEQVASTKEAKPAQLEGFIGLDSINAQKIEDMSVNQKLANDIGKGISGGIESLNTAQKEAQEATELFASGGDISVHEVMIAAEKSSLAMQMAIQLRNQMINAYSDFKNMQV